MVTQQLFYEFCLFGRQGFVIRVPAQDVFKQAFYLVDVVVFLTTELELLYLFVAPHSAPLLGFLFLIMVFSQVINDAIIMMAMLFPELIKILPFCFVNLQHCFAHFYALSFELLHQLRSTELLLYCEISLIFVKPHIG